MFGNSKNNSVKNTNKGASTVPNGMVNQLAEGTIIKGNIHSKCDIRIDGLFEGDLKCENKVVIGKKGKIKGNVICANADVLGLIDGDIQVNGILILRESSKVNGNIETLKISVENGAVINGTCKMSITNGTVTNPNQAVQGQQKRQPVNA